MATLNEFRATDVPALMTTIEAEGISDITGRPNHSTLMRMINELSYAAANIDCSYSQYGFMHLVLPINLYLQLTGENIVLPVDPGKMPPYVQNADAATNHAILLQWQRRKGLFTQTANVNKALMAVAKAHINQETRNAMQTLFVGNVHRTFHEWFDNLCRRYGRPTPHEHNANIERMQEAWDPVTTDVATIIKRIRDGSIQAYYANQSFQEHQLVHMLETLILNTGQFARQYEQWRSRPAAERTWNNMETWATEMYDLWLETSQPAANHGYGGNAEGAPQDDAAVDAAYAESLNAFSQANADNASTFQNHSATINNLTNNIGSQLQAMQAQIQGLAMAVNARPANANPQQAPYQAPYQAPPAPQYQMPYQQPYQHSGGRGGRGGRNYYDPGASSHFFQTQGRGGGRYGGRGQQGGRGSYQQPQGQYTGNRGNQPMNPIKRHKNWNYCWTHGHDVEDWHNSQSCPNPRPGHVHSATRENRCGGSMKAIHKTQM